MAINYSLFLISLLVAVTINGVVFSACGEVFTVGDESGWNMQVNYGSWSEKHNFTVGDILEFKYSKSEHNVYEVTREVFQTCNTSLGDVMAKYQTGNDQIELREGKKYWFICEIDGHCLGGMRLAIGVENQTVAAAAGNDESGSRDASSGYKDVYNFERCCTSFVHLVLVLVCIIFGNILF